MSEIELIHFGIGMYSVLLGFVGGMIMFEDTNDVYYVGAIIAGILILVYPALVAYIVGLFLMVLLSSTLLLLIVLFLFIYLFEL